MQKINSLTDVNEALNEKIELIQKELDAKEFMEGTKLGAEAVMKEKERNNTQT